MIILRFRRLAAVVWLEMPWLGSRGVESVSWRSLALSAGFVLCSCGLLSLYVLMRRITTSSDLFEVDKAL